MSGREVYWGNNLIYSDDDSQMSEGGWVQWFCSLEDHNFFCEVDEEYIRDNFNLYGLKQKFTHYKYPYFFKSTNLIPEKAKLSKWSYPLCAQMMRTWKMKSISTQFNRFVIIQLDSCKSTRKLLICMDSFTQDSSFHPEVSQSWEKNSYSENSEYALVFFAKDKLFSQSECLKNSEHQESK